MAHETDLISQLIEWLDNMRGTAVVPRVAEWYADELRTYHADLVRRDAVETSAFMAGRTAGANEAWNTMRNFVALRSGAFEPESMGGLVKMIADVIVGRSGDEEHAVGVIADVCGDLTREVKKRYPPRRV